MSEKFYCAVKTSDLPSIKEGGLRAGSYWISDTHSSWEELLDYYAEMEDNKGNVIPSTILCVDGNVLDIDSMTPDHPGIAEPITTALELDEDEVIEAWEECEGTARDSIEIIGTMQYADVIPSSELKVVHDDNICSLEDYLNEEYTNAGFKP